MKKILKTLGILLIVGLTIIIIINIHNWIVMGNQTVKISTSSKCYTNSDLYVSIIAQEHNVDLDTKSQVKLKNSEGKTVVGNDKIKYDGNNVIISIPDIEPGNYWLEAKVSSKAGKDTVKKEIYIQNGNSENITVNLDKGIYKPGDTVNFRALVTSKENDIPISKELNISIFDGNDNKVYNENAKTSDYGIVSGNFTLANEVNSGLYKLIIKTKSTEVTKQFKVNPYVTPKYEVKINYDKDNYIINNSEENIAKISFKANYFFGEPVQNATLKVYIDNTLYKTVTTDTQGNASIDYKMKDAKTYNVKVECIDSSNYYVEQTSTFTAGTDIFEIEVLPEYGNLIAEKKNNVYIFTKKADGAPVKAYVTVTAQNFTKQIATDENGIGQFSIDIGAISANKYSHYNYNSTIVSTMNDVKTFSVIAEDSNKNTVNKNITLDIEEKNLLISTNKVKYNQGEDINLNISSLTDNSKNIYFFKNDKLIKMLNTTLDETSINLDDTYGLIDIYVTDKNSSNYIPRYDYMYAKNQNSKTYKRTIFIKPTKQLKIGINTEKSEYKPGENIAISFNTTNENNNSVDSALLVSMLDNSILKLAENDLSIDNVKLALENIKFSNNLDAATLYSCIMDDTSEQKLMALLLKQGDKDISVSESTIRNYEEKEKSQIISIITIVILVAVVFICLSIKFKNLRNLFIDLLNIIILTFLIVFTTCYIIHEIDWNFEAFGWPIAIGIVASLIVYILFISKISKKISRTTISLYITILIYWLIKILVADLNMHFGVFTLTVLLIILALVILAKISKSKNLKIDKYMKKIIEELGYIFKYILACAISILIAVIINEILHIDELAISIFIISLYIFNKIINKIGKEVKETKNNESVGYKIGYGIAIASSVVGVIILANIVINDTRNSINNANMNVKETSRDYSNYGGFLPNSVAEPDSIKNEPEGSSILNGIESMLSPSKSDNKLEKEATTENVTKKTQETDKVDAIVDENIRNVFLESMCFIPELITQNGNAKLDMKLSDNITTWTIQTVGNTKDGRIGYKMVDNVKVFKDFFVDFELPKNLVETDKVSIPVTVHNYTKNAISTTVKIKTEDWFTLEKNNISINIDAESSNMVYVPITVLKNGNNKFRVEVETNNLTDIVEKECIVSPKGYKVEKVVSTGSLSEDITEDILFLEDLVENTAKAKVKIYANTMSQTVEGMENIFRMPTGCFEQISSSLYPNILALKYLEENGIVNNELKEKAISYISSGYQKILTYEVKGESGGYSLYGHSPAETVLTAYGLMEISDLSKVYNVDEVVIKKMNDFLYRKQNANGTFQITGSHIGGASSRDTLALNSYIIWALSEINPNEPKLKKSVEYLKTKISEIDDNYTLALVANVFANVKDNEANNVLKRLINNINLDGNNAYITSNIVDYYGSKGNVQTLQTVALTSMALSKTSYSYDNNKKLLNYIVSKKDPRGTWYSTQSTILALKAINQGQTKENISNQTIIVRVNSEEKKIDVKDNALELYEVSFDNLGKENKLNIDIQKGNASYEVVEEYYVSYDKVNSENDKIEIEVESNNNIKVNDILNSKIKAINRSNNSIQNGMITIAIPQGFTVDENSLMQLESKGIIEKYEYSYSEINIYIRNFEIGQIINLDVNFRASYPVDITGLSVRAYDYYNPDVEGKSMPIELEVN